MADSFLARFAFSSAQRRLFAAGLPLLTYHHVATPAAAVRDPFLYVTAQRFAEHLAALAAAGFTSGSLHDFPAAVAGNPNRKVVLTFDDGYVNVLENALPLLARHKFHGIQFIVADLIGRRNEWDVVHGEVAQPLMDRAQINDWLAAGNEIGSHSLTHRNLAKLAATDLPRAREEIVASKKKLEDLFARPIAHFSYPHGSSSAAVRDLVAEAGYTTACTTRFGVNHPTTPPFELQRVIPLSWSETFFKAIHRLKRKL